MENHTNRLGGSISTSNCNASIPQGPNFHPYKRAGAFTPDIRAVVAQMAAAIEEDRDTNEYMLCLLGMANYLVHMLEDTQEVLQLPKLNVREPSVREAPFVPERLPSFPPFKDLLKLSKDDQERLLEKRATALLREIEGLRSGYYVAPDHRSEDRMIEQARRRFRRLRNVAMQLGFWTDGRWEAGEEETHRV